jgi:hypothetical protein
MDYENYQQLREELQKRVAGMDAGQGREIQKDEELAAFFRDIESEVHRETARKTSCP